MMFGIGPDKELMEDLPEGISRDAAFASWMTGYREGAANQPHRIFENNPDIQPFYTAGWNKGADDLQVERELHGEPSQEELWSPHGATPAGLRKSLAYCEYYSGSLAGAFYAAGAVYLGLLVFDRLVGGRR